MSRVNIPALLATPDSKPWLVIGRISSIFGIVGCVGAIIALMATGSYSIPALVLAVYVCILATVLLILLLRQENRYIREARYAAATLPMWKAFSEVANASWMLFHGEGSQDAFRLRLRESLRRFAEAFTVVTGTQCRACIKLIHVPEDHASPHSYVVSTLCRHEEEAEPPRHRPDQIGDNTDFMQIFTENKPTFFSNNLIAQLKQGYRNSHWREEDVQNDRFDYVATIVWPIERGSTSSDQPSEREIVGFLCVDTLKAGAFVKTYDEALGASFARALFLAMYRFRETVPS